MRNLITYHLFPALFFGKTPGFLPFELNRFSNWGILLNRIAFRRIIYEAVDFREADLFFSSIFFELRL